MLPDLDDDRHCDENDKAKLVSYGNLLCASKTGDIYQSNDYDLIELYGSPDSSLLIKKLPDYFNSRDACNVLSSFFERKELMSYTNKVNFLNLRGNQKILAYQLPHGEMLRTWIKNNRLTFTGTESDQQFIAFLYQLKNILSDLTEREMQHGSIELDSIYVSNQGKLYLLDTLIVNAKVELLEKEIIPFQMVPNSEAITASPEQCFGRKITSQDDVFNLSVLIYQIYTGHHPYDSLNAVQALLAKSSVQEVEQLSSRRWDILKQGLTLQADKRISTVGELIELLFNYKNVCSLNPLLVIKPSTAPIKRKEVDTTINDTKSFFEKAFSYPLWLLIPIILGWLLGTGLMFFLLP